MATRLESRCLTAGMLPMSRAKRGLSQIVTVFSQIGRREASRGLGEVKVVGFLGGGSPPVEAQGGSPGSGLVHAWTTYPWTVRRWTIRR